MDVRQNSLPKDIRVTDELKDLLAYGVFNRVYIRRINRFSRFRDVSIKAKSWVGDRQVILTYDICEEKEALDEVFYEENVFKERTGTGKQRSKKLFAGITILQFKDSQKEEKRNFQSFLFRCKKNILNISQQNSQVNTSVFGTIGEFGIVIFWLSDQFVDVLNLITTIKNTNVGKEELSLNDGDSIFLSAYTIFVKNHPAMKSELWRDKVKQVKGEAILQLTLKQGITAEMKKELEGLIGDRPFLHCAGEYDILWKLPASEAIRLVESRTNEKEPPLFYKNEFYKKYVLQLSLKFCEEIPLKENGLVKVDSMSKKEDSSSVKKEYLPELGDIQTYYNSVRDALGKQFPYTAGMIDTLDLLYCDYIYKISVAPNEMWVEIFSNQFLKILCFINEMLVNATYEKTYLIKTINILLTNFERQISHIAESNNLVIGTPSCQLRYSGQNNLGLYAYFGIIKEALKYVYENQEVNEQDEIVPLIDVELVPIIQSSLYRPFLWEGRDSKVKTSRIVTINLPMTSLYDPVCYYPYLYHELFHYVVPKDRFFRNKLNEVFMASEILWRIFRRTLAIKWREKFVSQGEIEKYLSSKVNRTIMPYIYDFSVKHFMDEKAKKSMDSKKYREIHQESDTAAKFCQNFFSKWAEWVNKKDADILNPVFCFFIEICKNESVIKSNIFCGLLDYKEEKQENISKLREGLNEYFDTINGFTQNCNPDAANKKFSDFLSVLEEEDLAEVEPLNVGIREACADIAMVTMTGMDLAEYLLLFTKTKKDLLRTSCQKGDNSQDIIRIGMVLDQLYGHETDDTVLTQKFCGCFTEFISLYQGLYYNSYTIGKGDTWESICDEAKKWFEYWKACYWDYLIRYSIYARLFRKIREGQLVDSKKASCINKNYWKRYAAILRARGNSVSTQKKNAENDNRVGEELLANYDEQLFRLNIELIQGYQYQISFKELNDIRKNKYKEAGMREYKWESFEKDHIIVPPTPLMESGKKVLTWNYKVNDIKQFSDIIAKISDILRESCEQTFGEGDYPIWYRGQELASYHLLPSAMRKFKEKKERRKDNNFSLVKMLREEYEQFRFRTDGVWDVLDRSSYICVDYLALMQHYGCASNFLDWTEDAMTALYFSVDGFLDSKKPIRLGNAAIYMFSPFLYNRARLRMLQEGESMQDSRTPMEKDVLAYRQEGIPNLTVDYNRKMYNMYLLGEESYGDGNFIEYAETRFAKIPFYLPVAIYTSRRNKRIQAQHGTFLAFNVYTSPDANNLFDDISLENIQKRYWELTKNENKIYPFLYKIEIDANAKEKIASWIRALGMSKERFCPELENFSERIMR